MFLILLSLSAANARECTAYEATDYAVDGSPDSWRFGDNVLVGESGSTVGALHGVCYDVGTTDQWVEGQWFDLEETSTDTYLVPARYDAFVVASYTVYSIFNSADADVTYSLELSFDGGSSWQTLFSRTDIATENGLEMLSNEAVSDQRLYLHNTTPSLSGLHIDPDDVLFRARVEGGHATCDGAYDPASLYARLRISSLELMLCEDNGAPFYPNGGSSRWNL